MLRDGGACDVRYYAPTPKTISNIHVINNLIMKKILFLDDCNMFEGHDPRAYLVEISQEIKSSILHALEKLQIGALRLGGNWVKIMEDGEIEYKLLSSGKKSDYTENDYDEEYKLISGNY